MQDDELSFLRTYLGEEAAALITSCEPPVRKQYMQLVVTVVQASARRHRERIETLRREMFEQLTQDRAMAADTGPYAHARSIMDKHLAAAALECAGHFDKASEMGRKVDAWS
jgi:hypothetical protein